KRDFSDRFLPFGRLREPINSIQRADILVISYGDLEPFEYQHPQKPTLKMIRENWKVIRSSDRAVVENFQDLSFVAFAGLGDNQQFFETLQRLSIRIEKRLSFPDHYHYEGFKLKESKIYITTLKDAVKLKSAENLYYLDFDVKVDGLKEILEEFIISKLRRVRN
ncbi:MAG: tetraacyldisaccharide 4'-kinase, partial [Candidatus Kryptonium sp.]